MPFAPLPSTAAWQHRAARAGFEVAYLQSLDNGFHLAGCTTAVEEDRAWIVGYDIVLDTRWVTRSARISGRSGRCSPVGEDGLPHPLVPEAPTAQGVTAQGAAVSTRCGSVSTVLESDRRGHWSVDGQPAPQLDGCLDVDLESSALTNAIPVHRLGLDVDGVATAPAAYVRATDLGIQRLEQTYRRVADEGDEQRYDYTAAAFGVSTQLHFDETGLALSYPGIAVRAA